MANQPVYRGADDRYEPLLSPSTMADELSPGDKRSVISSVIHGWTLRPAGFSRNPLFLVLVILLRVVCNASAES